VGSNLFGGRRRIFGRPISGRSKEFVFERRALEAVLKANSIGFRFSVVSPVLGQDGAGLVRPIPERRIFAVVTWIAMVFIVSDLTGTPNVLV
jgi:hypothetical protein